MTAHGIYEAKLNGQKIGQAYLRPGFTSYGRRLQYDSLEVTSMLTKENRLEVLVARGWYSGMFGRQADNFGNDISLLCAFVIRYRDGSCDTIASDASWEYAVSPLASSLYDGEFIDTRVTPTDFKPVVVADFDKGNLVLAEIPPVRAHERFKGKFLDEGLFDFHQNLAGFVRLRIKGQPGDTLRIRHGEVLQRSGQLYMGNLREAKATDTYVLNGQAQVLAPHFTYHGFRYAQVEWKRGNTLLDVSGLDLMAVALYSDLPVTGSFSCSNPKLNQLQHNIKWSMKSNILDIPTDCPQRSERLGWTQDADAFCATASYLMDVKDFYKKWLRDLAADQNPDGSVSVTIPYVSYMKRDFVAAGWSDAAVWTPWTIYERYGDIRVLKEQYKSMKAWVDYVTRHDGHIGGFGDWYAAGPETDINYIDLCCWYRSATILQRTADLLGDKTDRKAYDLLCENIKKAFEKQYKDKIPQTQTAHVLGIYTGLLPGSDAGKLAELVKANHNHLATGFLGTPHLLEVLSANGYTDLAYQVLLQEDVPSWLYMVDQGATTLWEKWDAIRSDGAIQPASLNHYSFGSVGQWLYENIAGIRPLSPGYQKILIAPKPGAGLTWAKGSLKTAYGAIVSDWKISGGKYVFDIQIPEYSTATIRLPGQPEREVGSGIYHFIIDTAMTDGPYIFGDTLRLIRNGKVETKQVHHGQTIRVPLPQSSDQPFKVKLRGKALPEPAVYPQPEKLFAVSDIEGEFTKFTQLLIDKKIINKSYHWTFGKGHLVICGDLFDRGKEVMPQLWLLYRLEAEAKAAGGMVHTLLGNHDLMGFTGDYRYVDQKYFTAARLLGKSYSDLFAAGTVLGDWLRSRNMAEKIGDRLYLHGGISPEVNKLKLSIEQINNLCRSAYDQPKSAWSDTVKLLFGGKGPFWYRGYFMSLRMNETEIDQTLQWYGVKQIVVGHTILKQNPALYYGGKVLGIDTDGHEGELKGLLLEKGKWKGLQYKPENDRISDEDIL